MRVRCIADRPTKEQEAALKSLYSGGRQVFGVSVGMEYLVYGLRILNGQVLVDVAQEFDQLVPVPLCLFEITDHRVPGLWEARTGTDGQLFLWPPSFFAREFYHQDLAEGVASVVDDFQRVRRRLELESELSRT